MLSESRFKTIADNHAANVAKHSICQAVLIIGGISKRFEKLNANALYCWGDLTTEARECHHADVASLYVKTDVGCFATVVKTKFTNAVLVKKMFAKMRWKK